ncbi:hypothetical protein EDD21DRAFT_349294 [Dissophora ornata]|nr:hypothetical protein BGZ58_009024 [Dissophora ornata]KAI8606214.1 hypothetical protein EDD21DRAFT_349294 [Dissophora ornata]
MSTFSTAESSPWTSPKDPHALKRRHTRGNTAHSHATLRSASSSPSLTLITFSENSFTNKSHMRREESLHPIGSSAGATQPPRITDSRRYGYAGDIDDFEKSNQSTGVPSWFGSLRSFVISVNSSSRGAFTPLAQSPPSKPAPSILSPSRGRSSSIYYAGSLDDHDTEDDYGSENNYDEPLTSMNGLKENRVRGPRMNWAALDPSLGGLFPASYKAVPGSEPELSSPSCSSSASSLHSPTLSNIEDLAISEEPYRDDDSGDDGDDGGEESLSTSPRFIGDDLSMDENSYMSAYPTPSSSSFSAPTSALSFIRSYVPSLSNFHDINSGSTGTRGSGAKSDVSTGTGFWSIRKLSMNLLSNNQYAPVDTSEEAIQGRPETPGDGQVQDWRHWEDDESGESCKSDSDSRGRGNNDAGSPPVSYLSSILTTASGVVAAKSSQYISAHVRDNLEQLPIGSRGLKKIGRTD